MRTQHKKSEYVLTQREATNLVNSGKTFEHRCILGCLYYGGMRVSEVENLEVQHIDFARNVIHIIESKRGKSRTIPFIEASFKADVKHFVGKRTKDKVFPQKKRMLQLIVQRTAESVGLSHPDPTAKHVNAHILRHSIARHLKNMNYNPEFIQKYLGHSSIKTTMDEYGTLSLDDMQNLVQNKTRDPMLKVQDNRVVPQIIYND
jgi:integrase/recombinase XerD